MEGKKSVLVVGAGVFGASTALAILRSKRYGKVTIVDRADELPAIDSASYDLNKIVRYDYDDPMYARLTLEAMAEFKTSPWKGIYHESGVLVYGSLEEGSFYSKSLQNVTELDGKLPPVFENTDEFAKFRQSLKNKSEFPELIWPSQYQAYWNESGGWAEATESMIRILQWIREEGGQIISGQKVDTFIQDPNSKRIQSVVTTSGRQFEADIIILALGSWTEPSLANTPLATPKKLLHATAQCLTTYQLTPEQAERHRNDPVILSMQTGFYMFPPNKDSLVKATFHRPYPYGYSNPDESGISIPLTFLDHAKGESGSEIPEEDKKQSRDALTAHYPDLADVKLHSTRLCYYSDVPDHNFLIDRHPNVDGVYFATGGSGHGYKFLPVIGKYVLQRIEGTLDKEKADKWAYKDRRTHLWMPDRPPEPRNLRAALANS